MKYWVQHCLLSVRPRSRGFDLRAPLLMPKCLWISLYMLLVAWGLIRSMYGNVRVIQFSQLAQMFYAIYEWRLPRRGIGLTHWISSKIEIDHSLWTIASYAFDNSWVRTNINFSSGFIDRSYRSVGSNEQYQLGKAPHRTPTCTGGNR